MAAEKLHTQIRQEQLAEAALSLIGTNGMKALSMAALGRRLGLVPSAMYRHFASKEDLLDAVVDLIQDRLHKNVSAACESSSDALGRLRLLITLHARVIRENQGIPRVVFSNELAGSPQKRARLHRIVRSYLKQVAEIVRRGQQEGSIRSNIDPETISVMFLGIVQPAAFLWHLSDGGFDVTKHAEKAWKLLSQAIRAR